MAAVIGIDAKMWAREVTGTTSEGAITYSAWSELTNVRNVNLSLSAAEADVTVRANDGWRASVPTLKEASIDFEMVYDSEDAGFQSVRGSYFDGTILHVRVLDGGTTEANGIGLDAHVRVSTFSINQTNEDAITVSVSVKPTYAGAAPAPSWFVPSSNP